MRFFGSGPGPLWIDETFTGAIATQPNWSDVIHFARLDAPPSALYYLIMHGWTSLFGASNASLRLPSLLASAAAPLVVALVRTPGIDRTGRLIWAALLSLWVQGVALSFDARAYGLLFLSATLMTLSFAALLREPTLRRAVLWVVLADLTIAFNYDAAYLALAQGLIYLAVKKKAALATWPAALLVLPILAELAWKWPILTRLEAPATAWYADLVARDLWSIVLYPLGGAGFATLVWLVFFPVNLAAAWWAGRRLPASPPMPGSGALSWAASAALMGMAAMVAVGFFRPSFTLKYLVSFEPGLCLGVVLWLSHMARGASSRARFSLLLLALIASGAWLASGAPRGSFSVFPLNIEQASDIVMNTDEKRAVFAWDAPLDSLMSPQLVTQVGSFFFRRAHRPIGVTSVRLPPGEDPNLVLIRAAAPTGAAILWLYDDNFHDAAKAHPPRIDQISPLYHCRKFHPHPGTIGSVVCLYRQPPEKGAATQ